MHFCTREVQGGVSLHLHHTCIYHYVLFTVTGMSTSDHLDFELQAKEGTRLLPGVRVAPSEHLLTTDMQVRELCWPY